jgi:signal peptidase II
MMQPARGSTRLALAVLLLACFVGCDQTTKHVAQKHLRGNPPISYLANTVRLEFALNPGGFLSIGGNLSPQFRFWTFAGLNAVLLLGTTFVLIAKWKMHSVQFVALVLVLAGGIGNLIDRVLQNGLVTDFLNVGVGPVRTGIFNVADMALMAGTALLVLMSFRKVPHSTPAAGSA